MILRISAVAVCRSSASLVSLNKRTFSIAMTAWSAKVFNRAICSSENGTGSRRVTLIAPMGIPPRSIGTETTLRQPPATAVLLISYSGSSKTSGT